MEKIYLMEPSEEKVIWVTMEIFVGMISEDTLKEDVLISHDNKNWVEFITFLDLRNILLEQNIIDSNYSPENINCIFKTLDDNREKIQDEAPRGMLFNRFNRLVLIFLLILIIGPIIFIIEFPNDGYFMMGKIVGGLISFIFWIGSFKLVMPNQSLVEIESQGGVQSAGPGVTLIATCFTVAWLIEDHWSFWIFIFASTIFFFVLWDKAGTKVDS